MRLIEKYNNNLDIYDNNYHLCFNQPIGELSIKNALDASIGSGNYSMVLSVEDSVYTPWYASTGESTQNYCMMLYYYINPTQNHTFELKNITSIFKETLDTTIKIPPHVISNQHKYVSLVGNMINVLPV
jgi:hypothetical protein